MREQSGAISLVKTRVPHDPCHTQQREVLRSQHIGISINCVTLMLQVIYTRRYERLLDLRD